MELASAIAHFTANLDMETMPPSVIEKARTCLLNGYGIALGCNMTPYAPVARQAVLAMDGEQHVGATLLGDGRKTSVAGATLANAALFHGRAQEDTCGAAHFGAIMLPLLTAMLERHALPSERLLPALVSGYEVGGLFESSYSSRTTPAGLRATALYGPLAAAAAAARLMDLDEELTAAALSNAASFTGGILQSFDDGTDEWRYQAGMAGVIGYNAVQLAAAGSVAAPHAFEGRTGFVKTYARIECEVGALTRRLGRDWSIHNVTFKPYPVCAFNQTPVKAALLLRERIGNARLKYAQVRMNPYETGYAGMDSTGPFSSLSGTLMSIPFCIANTLQNGIPNVTTMTTYDDVAVNALVNCIKLVPDESVERLSCVIEVELEDGRTLVEDLQMKVEDYAYDRSTVASLVRRVGAETNVPATVYDRLEHYVENMGPIHNLIDCFSLLSPAR